MGFWNFGFPEWTLGTHPIWHSLAAFSETLTVLTRARTRERETVSCSVRMVFSASETHRGRREEGTSEALLELELELEMGRAGVDCCRSVESRRNDRGDRDAVSKILLFIIVEQLAVAIRLVFSPTTGTRGRKCFGRLGVGGRWMLDAVQCRQLGRTHID